jgi:hypothetical protein
LVPEAIQWAEHRRSLLSRCLQYSRRSQCWPELQICLTQLTREGSPPPGLHYFRQSCHRIPVRYARTDSPVRIRHAQGGSRLRVAAAGRVSPSIARRAGSAAAMAAFARSRRRKGPRAAPSQCDRSLCNLILYPFPNSGTAAGLRRSRRDTQDGARSSASSPTSRPASPRERRPRARPRSSLPTRRATRRG